MVSKGINIDSDLAFGSISAMKTAIDSMQSTLTTYTKEGSASSPYIGGKLNTALAAAENVKTRVERMSGLVDNFKTQINRVIESGKEAVD